MFGNVKRSDINNEIRAVKKLCRSSHLHIVQVFQLGQLKSESTFYFIDMELCSLNLERYSRGEDIPFIVNWKSIRERNEIALKLCEINAHIIEGLIFIHENQEVHRDLSPHNGTFLVPASEFKQKTDAQFCSLQRQKHGKSVILGSLPRAPQIG